MLFEYQIIKCRIPEKKAEFKPDDDADVQEENRKVRNRPEDQLVKDNAIVLKNVTKKYVTFDLFNCVLCKKFLAVDGVCLRIKMGECFGLLGVNGAGKTSTFKMMVGEENISAGKAWVQSHNVTTQNRKIRKFLGYCPQFDALPDEMRVSQVLKMYLLIRGDSCQNINTSVRQIAEEFGFEEHLKKKMKNLSGGTKRKVSTAVAAMGNSTVIYLDEPTTGMDPESKRKIWDAVCKLRDEGRCVVLTTHSMEECEALCTKVVIMVNGKFQCIGSIQHLKNKFAQNCSLTIRARAEASDRDLAYIQNFVNRNFQGAVLKEQFQSLLLFSIPPSKAMSWSRIFGVMERARAELRMEDYSVGQPSLEEVLVLLSRDSMIETLYCRCSCRLRDFKTNNRFGFFFEYILENFIYFFSI